MMKNIFRINHKTHKRTLARVCAPVCVLILFSWQALAQVKTYDLQFNPQLYYFQKQNHAEKRALDTLILPFIDDFSYEGPYPDPARWLDKEVYINDNYPTNKLSYGVATFDGLNEFGLPYNDHSLNAYGPADTLTSQPINLQGLDAGDSVFLSFAFEPKGIGDKPDEFDSLILEFKLLDTIWQQAWASPGSDSVIVNPQFSNVLLHITDPFFFNNAFQFRFRNMATISGNNDHWHLDYVYLNSNRGFRDSIIRDVAFLDPASNFLNDYASMPWNHFEGYENNETDSLIFYTLRNNSSTPFNTRYSYSAYEAYSNAQIFSDLPPKSMNFSPFADSIRKSAVSNFIPYSPSTTDSVRINIETQLAITGFNISSENDTITSGVEFRNYFAYDDGTAERAFGLEGPGLKKFAYEFNLNEPDTLRAVQVHFSQINQNLVNLDFTLMVWSSIDLDNDGVGEDTLYFWEDTSVCYLLQRNGFATFCLDAPAVVQGTFYIGWQQTFDEDLQIGLDLNNSATEHISYYTDGTWKLATLVGAPMLRPVVGKGSLFTCNPDLCFVNTGIRTVNFANENFLHPNPVRDVIYLNLPERNLRIDIYDMQGRVVKSISAQRQLDVSDLKPGLYCLRAWDDKNKALTQKFIKQ